jgi:hypothetical protein
MKSALHFLLAARHCEIADLEQLANTSELVTAVACFIHALQRERGISSIYLGSHGAQFARQCAGQVGHCDAAARAMRQRLDAIATQPGQARNGSRLFSRVAMVLHGLEALPALRARIARRELLPADAGAAFDKLIAGLLAVVFEAADTASDPAVSRALLAMFNFMQGKEFAGQERALGARVFVAGSIEGTGQQHWHHLVDSQHGCFQVFADHADPAVLRFDEAARDPLVLAEIGRLRGIGCTLRAGADVGLSHEWYRWCTRRIDEMKLVEDRLALHLRRLCGLRIAQARGELRDERAALDALSARMDDAGTPVAIGPHLEHSLLDLVQAQSRRLQALGDELDAVRATLGERKLVERAKGLLMAHRQMTEDDAHKALREMAMNQNRRIVEVAAAVLSLAQVLPAVR